MTGAPPDSSDAEREGFRTLLRERRRELQEARRVAATLEERLRLAEGQLAAVLNSRLWRTATSLMRLRNAVGMRVERLRWPRLGAGPGASGCGTVAASPVPIADPSVLHQAVGLPPHDAYEDWISRFDILTSDDEAALRRQAADPALPSLLLVCPFDAANGLEVPRLLSTLRQQFFTRWRLFLAAKSDLGEALLRATAAAAAEDARVQVWQVPHGASATGVGPDERLVVLRPETILRSHALGVLAAAATDPAVHLVYGDSDRLGPDQRRHTPFFKPGFSPELLRGLDYLSGCVLLGGPAAALDALLRSILMGADASDMVRRFATPLRGEAAVHLPLILSHDVRRPADAHQRTIVPTATEAAMGPGPLASIIIPTRGRVELLRPCVESVLRTTAADRVEIIVVDNDSNDEETLGFLQSLEDAGVARILRVPGPFNFAHLNNTAVAAARGDVLVFLNNDTVMLDPGWLRLLTSQATVPDVGAVGAKLLYPDLTVQHGGIVLGIDGTVAHADVGRAADDPGDHGLCMATREVSAVTAACLAMRRQVFDRIGGFDPNLAVAFNDVKLCLDALSLGYRNICLAHPLLVHHEAQSRGRDDSHAKIALFREEARRVRSSHRALFLDDPYYNPNLSLRHIGDLAVPPRWIRPWRREGRPPGRLRVLIAAASHERDRIPAMFVAGQATALLRRGHEVIVAGPRGAREPDYEGCRRIVLADAELLAVHAIAEAVDCVMSHAPLFHPVTRWLGRACATVVHDYGDPHRALFPDADSHFAALAEMQLCRDLADRVISSEANGAAMGASLRGNIGMAVDPALRGERRARVRAARNWGGRVVILTSVPLARGEALWSGMPTFRTLLETMELHHPALAARCVFVANGGGTSDDLDEVAGWGIVTVPDDPCRTAEIFAAADLYVDLSLSPDFGLGIGRALAHGLPVVAIDLPAHRGLPVFVSDDPAVRFRRVVELVKAAQDDAARQPVLYEGGDWASEAVGTLEAVNERRLRTSFGRRPPC